MLWLEPTDTFNRLGIACRRPCPSTRSSAITLLVLLDNGGNIRKVVCVSLCKYRQGRNRWELRVNPLEIWHSSSRNVAISCRHKLAPQQRTSSQPGWMACGGIKVWTYDEYRPDSHPCATLHRHPLRDSYIGKRVIQSAFPVKPSTQIQFPSSYPWMLVPVMTMAMTDDDLQHHVLGLRSVFNALAIRKS